MSKVYYLKIKSEPKICEVLETAGIKKIVKPNDFCAVKLHFGEKDNKGYLKPVRVKPVVDYLKSLSAKPFLTDTNTIYVGQRANAVQHLNLANEHGFNYDTVGCPVIIADGLRGNSYVKTKVNLTHFKNVSIAHDIHYSDSIVFMTHFKGHMVTGFGGTLKNMGMGCPARRGKFEIHNNIKPQINTEKCIGCGECIKWCPGKAITVSAVTKHAKIDSVKCIGCGECILTCNKRAIYMTWGESTKTCQEKIVEYAFGAVKNKRFICVNYIVFVTKDCDCVSTQDTPLIDNIGIMISTDPVAIDQASADMVNNVAGYDFFRKLWPKADWRHPLIYAEKIGLGLRKYELIKI